MCPVIRISDELYAKLEELAVGFDTPANVIERLVAAGAHGSADKPVTYSRATPFALLENGFRSFFQVEPRPFGQKAGAWVGFSDDNHGVQWNVALHRETGAATLGVNLEGMKYADWPIARFLLKEQGSPELQDLSTLSTANKITVHVSRDAWQASARPNIHEKDIGKSGILLSDLTQSAWVNMVQDALACLDSLREYRGRATQRVTLIKSGQSVERKVSPHLTVRTELWNAAPVSSDEVHSCLEAAHSILLPIYTFVTDRSKS